MSTVLADPDPFPQAVHDHGRCVRTALAQAEALCQARGAKLTDLRRDVLELVWGSHAPVGAYELMEQLSTRRGRVAPPTVYRALDFLSREGLVHRIDSLNAFVGCPVPQGAHHAVFLICRSCRIAAEVHDDEALGGLEHAAGRAGFALEGVTVELSGLCRHCREIA